MLIDNFDIIRSHLTFEPAMKFDAETKKLKRLNDTYDRYIVQILRRAKDVDGKEYGVNTSNRLIKTYEISSLEYFDKKRAHIMDLCRTNKARAYILPQVRATYDCLKEMLKLVVDNLENPTIKFQHVLRSALCSMHKSRDKRWILDLDDDNMMEYILDDDTVTCKEWTPEKAMELVRGLLSEIGRNPDDAYMLRTPHGKTIVTPPFNLQEANKRCNLIYQGSHKPIIDVTTHDGKKMYVYGELKNGWLIKDGMALLYFCDDDLTEI